MNKITFPLKPEMRGDTVANLQDGLLLLLDTNRALFTPSPTLTNIPETTDWPKVIKSLQKEREKNFYGKVTRALIDNFQKVNNLEASGFVDELTADALNRLLTEHGFLDKSEQYSVSGQVAEVDGTGINDMVVRAYDKCLGKEQELGTTSTDAEGHYTINYRVEQLINPARKQADLLVKVYTDNEMKSSSPLIINALKQEVVNLVISEEAYRGPDLYSQLDKQLAEYLVDIDLETIEPRDLYCLVNNTALNIEWIHHYVRARQWANEWEEMPAEVFFAWFRGGLPTEWGSLLGRSLDELRSSIEQAVDENLISQDTRNSLEKLEANLIVRRSRYVITANDQPITQASLGQLLETSSLSPDQGRMLLQQWQTFEGEAGEFWAEQRERLGESVSQDLDLTLQLGVLTRNHLPLITVLKGQAHFRQFTDVARLSQQDWLRLFEQADLDMPDDLQGDDLASKQQAYAQALTDFTEQLMPTRVVAEAIAQDDDIESQNLDRFFNKNPEFEFRHQSVRQYLTDSPDMLNDFDDPKALQLELEALQRVFHLSPANNRYTATKVLWQNKLHSAWSVTMRGEDEVVKLFPEEHKILAKQVVQQARAVQNVTDAYSLVHYDLNNPFGRVLQPDKTEIEGVPDLESLFGAQGYCECKHCLSFFSPSAYLTDLLLYLKRAGVQQTLFDRRSDIANIELDCENSHTALPYIDLVNEILENAIADTNAPFPQTEFDSEILKAFPQHLNPAVYNILLSGDQGQGVFYPWNLPFNLWATEVRTYLQHLQIPRWQLMESVLGQSDEVSISAEYLDLIPEEMTILLDLNANPATLDQYWGISGALDELKEVPKFLQQSGFSYQDLGNLLELRYIQDANPTNTLEIKFEPESSCQVDDAQIDHLNAEALSRLHRLGRLQRKTGDKLVPLDQALLSLGGEISTSFLTDYAYLQRVEQVLPRKISRSEILSWWGLLDTHNYPLQNSLYKTLFMNPDMSPVVDEKFELDVTQKELKNIVVVDLENPNSDPNLRAMLLAALQPKKIS